jgi:queuine tRNA-ribosyltransferase
MGYTLFDSTMPTRDARHGRLLTFEEPPASSALTSDWYSHTYIQDSKYIRQDRPISAHCDCLCCKNYSLAYLHHLYRVNDSLFYRLATMHNLRFMMQLMARLREMPA